MIQWIVINKKVKNKNQINKILIMLMMTNILCNSVTLNLILKIFSYQ